MPSEPSVALIIAAKDAAGTIGRAITSALDQAPVAEVIVVVDGAGDDTAAVAHACDDRSGRLSVLELPRNLGPSAARNQALAQARSPLVGVLDADDYLAPGRVAAMLAAAPAAWDLLADNLITEREGETGLLVEPDPPAPARLDAEAFVRGNLTDPARPRRELGFLKPLIRREFLERHGLAYDETLRLGEDYVLYAEALVRGGVFVLVGACGYVAVERAESLSGRHRAEDLAALAEADRRLLALAKDRPNLVRALEAHLHATRLKRDYRFALAARREGRLAAALGHVFRTPATAGYILGQTARAWTARLLRRMEA